MEENKLPEIFETFGDARKNGFVTVKELKDKGESFKKITKRFRHQRNSYSARGQTGDFEQRNCSCIGTGICELYK